MLDGEPSDADREQIEAFRRLGSLLGATVLVEEGDDVADVAARVARERRTTYVVIGTPAPRTGLRRFSEPLTDRLLRAMPGVDIRIVADRANESGCPDDRGTAHRRRTRRGRRTRSPDPAPSG